ncbi:MAG: cell division protein FtsQ/DivIB [Candidatus Limnocylindrales bacterium]
MSLVNRWRVLGFFVAVASATGVNWLLTSHAFDLDPSDVEVSSLVYTQPDVVRQAISLPEDAAPNIFRIDTRSMSRALEALPAVARADVYLTLPHRLVVSVTERTPTFVLTTPAGAFVLDVDGFVLDELPPAEAIDLSLPVVDDVRDQFGPDLEVGGRLDQVSLDAMLRLAAITPELIGTAYETMSLKVDDTDGYVLSAEPDGWRAVFGHYTPNLRPVDLIDRQVQCLRARVEAGEQGIAVIYLATLDDRCGTFLPERTPVESAPPSPPA